MIQEVLVVEGKQDVAAIRRAVEADCIITEGFTLKAHALENIRHAYEKRGIIILTDPDGAGERIRRFLTERFPAAKHAFIPRDEATANDDVGVEQASPESIRRALEKARCCQAQPEEVFAAADLQAAALSGCPASAARRAALGAALGVGYANAKTFLRRLNHYGVSREEFAQALGALDAREEAQTCRSL